MIVQNNDRNNFIHRGSRKGQPKQENNNHD